MCTVHIFQNRYLLPKHYFKDCFITSKEKYRATKTQTMSVKSYIEAILKKFFREGLYFCGMMYHSLNIQQVTNHTC